MGTESNINPGQTVPPYQAYGLSMVHCLVGIRSE